VQALLVEQISGPVHKGGYWCIVFDWVVVVETRVEGDDGVSVFMVCLMTERSVNMYVQGRKVLMPFHLNCELIGWHCSADKVSVMVVIATIDCNKISVAFLEEHACWSRILSLWSTKLYSLLRGLHSLRR
jgi:hypothetical protein